MAAATAEEQLVLLDQILHDPTLTSEEKIGKLRKLRQPSKHGKSKSKSMSKSLANGVRKLSVEEQMQLITSNLQETLNPEIIENVLRSQNRPLRIYWGTATTGRPHCGYFVAVLKIAEFLRAGCNVKILLADIHGFLDNLKAPIELVNFRAIYYKHVITGIMKALQVPIEKLEFVLGSSYQLTSKYMMDLLRSCTAVTINSAKKAGSEVVKQVEDATLSGLIYPLMQTLDEEYLGVDVQFGGVDQRKIFTLAKELLPRLGYKERAHLMNPMVPGLAGGKMSASDPNSKIDVLDKPEVVKKKIGKAYCVPKETEENGLLGLVQYTLLPASALKHGRARMIVGRREGEPLVYETIEQMVQDYKDDILTPQALKSAVTDALNELLAPIQAEYEASPEWQQVANQAYPSEEIKKPKKQKKDKGSKYPGAGEAKVESRPNGEVEGTDKDQVDLGSSAADALKELKVEK